MPTLFLTGAAGELGREVTGWFLEHGWNVAAISRNFPRDYEEKFSAYKKNLRMALADATNEVEMNAATKAAKEKFGTIDAALLGVGGIHKWNDVSDISLEEFHRVINLNLTSAFVSARAVLGAMETSGVLVFLGAQPALRAEAKKSAYAIAKAGVVKLAETIALEKKGTGIRSNVIVPGVLRTASNLEWATGGQEKNWVPPRDVAAMVAHFATGEGRSITGAVIVMGRTS